MTLFRGELKSEICRQIICLIKSDLMISAHALSLDAILITNNTKEFCRVDQLTLDNWV